MFSLKEMGWMGLSPTASTLFSAYTSFIAMLMFVRSMVNELSRLVPDSLRTYLSSVLESHFRSRTNHLTLLIDESDGMTPNQVYQAAEVYLRTKINLTTTQRLRVYKAERQELLNLTFDNKEEITDSFEDDKVELIWRFLYTEPKKNSDTDGKHHFELTFHKRLKDMVLSSYLPYVMVKAKEIQEKEKAIMLYHRGRSYHLNHPSTFDTLALDPQLKKFVIDDLDRFLRRREFYKKVGKTWKRGYLLYGPPGTGKSSMIAAMANYLKFNIYDLELTSLSSDFNLRKTMSRTSSRSIVVIEDIDCIVPTYKRQSPRQSDASLDTTKLTLSGLLNFIDGLWSSFGDGRIIVFTTNHKDRLDPALLRPGRMDVHINMSYCTVEAFKFLVSNYLGLAEHGKSRFYEEAGRLIEKTQVTPAEVAEELLKSEDTEAALEGLVNFLRHKKVEQEAKNFQQRDCPR